MRPFGGSAAGFDMTASLLADDGVARVGASLDGLLVEPAGAVRRAHQRARHDAGEADLVGLVLELDELLGLDPALDRVVPLGRPEVLAHNVETVPRIFKRIRPAFRYDRSLDVLTQARDYGLVTKSNLILGMGETREEISLAMRDLHDAGCELVTITQYLRPSLLHHPVERWVRPEEFVELAEEAEEIGFAGVLSGPLVRSSYRAGRLYRQAMDRRAAVETAAL